MSVRQDRAPLILLFTSRFSLNGKALCLGHATPLSIDLLTPAEHLNGHWFPVLNQQARGKGLLGTIAGETGEVLPIRLLLDLQYRLFSARYRVSILQADKVGRERIEGQVLQEGRPDPWRKEEKKR